MNTAMLKYLVELSNNEVDVIDHKAFFARFPEESCAHELYSLRDLGFITLLSGDDRICGIGVNKKAIDYLKKKSS